MMKHAFKKHMCCTHVSFDLHFTHFSPPSWRLKFLRPTRMVRVNITGLAPPTKKSVKKNSLFGRWKTATRFGSSQKQLMNNLMIFAFIYLQYTLYTNSIQNQKHLILIHFGSEMLYLPSLSLLVTTKHKSPEKPSTWMRKGHSSAWQPGETLTIGWLSTTHPPKIIIYSKGGSIIQYHWHIQVFKQVTWQLSGPGLCWLYH